MMPMWRVGQAFGRVEGDPARNRLARVRIDNRHVYPVFAAVNDFQSDRFAFDRAHLFAVYKIGASSGIPK